MANCYVTYTGGKEDTSTANEANTYTRGFLVESDKEWYHGELSRDEAEQALKKSGCNCFLIRHSQEVLVLSLVQNGSTTHIQIKYGPGWYKLEGSTQTFSELHEVTRHYQNSRINDDLDKLGLPCKKMKSSRHGLG